MSEFADSFHKVTTSILTQLIAFLPVKYRGTDQAQSPLTTHPTTMLIALSSLVVYYVLHVLLLRFPRPGRFASVAERFLVCSGYVAVATLAAAVFPEGASPFLYAIFGSLSAIEVLYCLYMCGQNQIGIKEDDVVEIEEEEVKIKDDDVVEIEEEEGSRFEVYKTGVCLCFEYVSSGLGKLAKFFEQQPPPIPI